MKKVLIILVIGITLFGIIPSVYAIDYGAVLTNDEFNKKLQKKGYDIITIDDNTSATKGNISFQFTYFEDEDQAKAYIAKMCETVDSYEYTHLMELNCSRDTVNHKGYVSVLRRGENYNVVSRRNNTIISAVGKDEDEDEINSIMKELGYYYDEEFSSFNVIKNIFSIIWLIGVIIAVILGVTRGKRLKKRYQYDSPQPMPNNMSPYQNYPNNYYRF